MKLNLYVAVTDMERAVGFYRAVFQMEPVQQSDRFSAFQHGDAQFGLMNKAAYSYPLTVGNNCVPDFGVANIDAEHVRIKALASTITEIITVGPFRLFMFVDTEGNVLEFHSRS